MGVIVIFIIDSILWLALPMDVGQEIGIRAIGSSSNFSLCRMISSIVQSIHLIVSFLVQQLHVIQEEEHKFRS